jgi:hypothetical protein
MTTDGLFPRRPAEDAVRVPDGAGAALNVHLHGALL